MLYCEGSNLLHLKGTTAMTYNEICRTFAEKHGMRNYGLFINSAYAAGHVSEDNLWFHADFFMDNDFSSAEIDTFVAGIMQGVRDGIVSVEIPS